MSAARAIAVRAFADARIRTLSFALLFAGVAAANAIGYRHSFPTLEDRVRFAQSFGEDKSIRLFYGVPHDLLTVDGYVAWRSGGVMAVFAAMWGLLAAVRALRTEEDAGRQELVLAGAVTRTAAFLAALAAVGAGALVLWLALFASLVAVRLPASGSAYLALAIVAVVPVFVGIGALASQVAPTRRVALELGSAAITLAFLLRVVADTSSLDWLRWATPLGWVEELRPFADPRPGMLVPLLLSAAVLLTAAAFISVRRDAGRGLLQGKDSAAPRLHLLSSPTALALRGELGSLAGWLAGIGVFALVVGLLSTSFTSANIPANLREQLEKLGGASITTPAGALGFYFLLFVLAISLFACSQIAAARREEADQQLETLLALPLSRRRWLGGRLVLGAAGAAALAFTAAVLGWAGAASQGADIAFPRMLEAGANCLPTTLLFLALGALGFALFPRASAGIAYGLTSLAFLWELFGALLGVPAWTLDLTPFHHIGLVPAQPFRGTGAVAMLAVAALAALAAVRLFERRDLTGA